MPYQAGDTPKGAEGLPSGAKSIFIKAFNSAYQKHGEEAAFKIAWSAVKQAGYHKNKDGHWVKKMLYTLDSLPSQVLQLSEEFRDYWFAAYKSAYDIRANDLIASKAAWKVLRGILELPYDLPLYISKANLDSDGRMLFVATASDTKQDVFTEKMSLELFQGFIRDFRGDEYVSLSHYKRLEDGTGEIGRIDKIYLDGNYMKVKGYFNETPLGKATYNAIRKDRRDDIPVEKRVRVSIGFYDRHHKHGDNLEWKYNINEPTPCVYCLMGMKEKTYLYGLLDHVAATRRPANRRTDIEAI